MQWGDGPGVNKTAILCWSGQLRGMLIIAKTRDASWVQTPPLAKLPSLCLNIIFARQYLVICRIYRSNTTSRVEWGSRSIANVQEVSLKHAVEYIGWERDHVNSWMKGTEVRTDQRRIHIFQEKGRCSLMIDHQVRLKFIILTATRHQDALLCECARRMMLWVGMIGFRALNYLVKAM